MTKKLDTVEMVSGSLGRLRQRQRLLSQLGHRRLAMRIHRRRYGARLKPDPSHLDTDS